MIGYLCGCVAKVGKGTLFYGGITMLITIPTTYQFAYEKGIKDANSVFLQKPTLEKVSKYLYRTHHPQTYEPLILNFKSMRIEEEQPMMNPSRKQLEELF